MNRYRTLLPVLAVAAPLALAATASAADYGSDLNPVHQQSSLSCPSYPCTMTQQDFGSSSGELPRDGVITHWRIKLSNGAHAKLRLLENNLGSSYWPKADGASVTGTGGLSEADTRIPLNGGHYYAGIELTNGSVLTDKYADPTALLFQGSWPQDEWRTANASTNHELLSQVTVEPDVDGDGYGDTTQDSCVFCSTGGGGSTGGGPSNSGSGSSGLGASNGKCQTYSCLPQYKFDFDKRGFYEIRNGKPRITLYFKNGGKTDLKGSVKLRYGKTTLKQNTKYANDIDVETDTSGDTSNFKVPRQVVRALDRRGSVTLTVTATLQTKSLEKKTEKQTITVRRGGLTNRYDGTYKGSNGILLVVSGGFLVHIDQTLNTFCSGSNKFMLRTLYTLGGYPLMVGRDGSFTAKGSNSPDSIRYEGKLKPKGDFKGYSSIFHTQLRNNSEGRIAFEQCFAASNWTAHRVKK